MLRTKTSFALIIAMCLIWVVAWRRPGGQGSASMPKRPPIVGVAHIGLQVSDLKAAENFYGHVLGFDHFSLNRPSGEFFLSYYKVNDHQYLEIYPTLKDPAQDRMTHFAF